MDINDIILDLKRSYRLIDNTSYTQNPITREKELAEGLDLILSSIRELEDIEERNGN